MSLNFYCLNPARACKRFSHCLACGFLSVTESISHFSPVVAYFQVFEEEHLNEGRCPIEEENVSRGRVVR
jgi:hypothetical protein